MGLDSVGKESTPFCTDYKHCGSQPMFLMLRFI